MRYLIKTVKWVFGFVLLFIALLYLSGYDYLLKAVRATYMRGHSTASIDDYPYFHNRVILSETPQPWQMSKNYNQMDLTDSLRDFLEEFHTVAFLIIQNGEIAYEEYWDGYSGESKSNSFSMAKTVVTTLLVSAIQDGYIKGMDQPVSDFFPKYNKGLAAKVTLGDLSRMSSGLDWKENYYLPFNATTQSYFDDDLDSLILGLDIIEEPGEKFKYLSGATELLAMVLQKATGGNITTYLSEKFWKPMGMNADGLWGLDGDGDIEKAFCCIYSNARNFAKFGQLYLQKGNWNGKQLIDTSFVELLTRPALAPQYGYSWWMDYEHVPPFYSMIGHLGQLVIVMPKYELIIVRLGKMRDITRKKIRGIPADCYLYMREVLKMPDIAYRSKN